MTAHRLRNNLLATLLVVFYLALMLLLGGCAGEGIRIDLTTPDKTFTLKTDYQIENGLKIHRNIETGEYDVELGSATTKDTEAGLYMLIAQMMNMLGQAAGLPAQPAPVPVQPAPTPQQ